MIPRELLHRVVEFDLDVLDDLHRLLIDRGRVELARWVRLERDGYGADTTTASLSEILGVPASSALLQSVMRARLRNGRFRLGERIVWWPHFFVEPLQELSQLADRVGKAGVLDIVVELHNPPGVTACRAPRRFVIRRPLRLDLRAR